MEMCLDHRDLVYLLVHISPMITAESAAEPTLVRENLADVVDRASHDELTIITKGGREVAAIVLIEMVREYRDWEEKRVLRIINERRAAVQPGIYRWNRSWPGSWTLTGEVPDGLRSVGEGGDPAATALDRVDHPAQAY
jgi:prevent-host-death family protein